MSTAAWLKTATIPADRASSGSFQDLRIHSEKQMREIVDGLEARPYGELNDEEKKLRDFYDAFMDQKQIDSRGLAPAQTDLALIAHLKTKNDVARAMGSVKLMATGPFDVNIGTDDKIPNAYSINLSQADIGLPDREYYLRDDKEIVATRDAYKKYLATILEMAGVADAGKRAGQVYDLELQIAKAQWANADRRDEDKTYNPMSFSDLEKLAPQYPWAAYFAGAGIPLKSAHGERQVIVAEKSAFPKLAEIFASTPVSCMARLSDGSLSALGRRLSAEEIRRHGFRLLRHGRAGQYATT